MLKTKKIIFSIYFILFCSSLSFADHTLTQPDSSQHKLVLSELLPTNQSIRTARLTWWQKLGLKILQKKINKKIQKSSAILEHKTDIWAILSFISGVLAWFVLGLPLGLAAVTFGAISIARIDTQPATRSGRGWAIAGLILGSLAVVLLLFGFLALIIG